MSIQIPQYGPTQRNDDEALRALYAAACQHCGVCCLLHAFAPFNIPVDQDATLPKKLVQIGPRNGSETATNRYMRVIPDTQWKGFRRCAALEGVQGVAVSCAVYEERPNCCRNYDPGSPACLNAREWAGLNSLAPSQAGPQ